MKFVIGILLIFMGTIHSTAAQHTITDEDVTMENGVILNYLGSARNIIIPEVLHGDTVKVIGMSAFRNNYLTSVLFPSTIIHIEDNAFSENAITYIDLPVGVRTVGKRSFMSNEITYVSISKTVVSIGELAFSHNDLKAVEFGNNSELVAIARGAFNNNMSTLEYIYLPLGTGKWICYTDTGIEFSAGDKVSWRDLYYHFERSGTHTLTENEVTFDSSFIKKYYGAHRNISIPDSLFNQVVKGIGYRAFDESALKSVIFPESIDEIRHFAFDDNELTAINLPKNITTIGAASFNDNHISEINGKESNGVIYKRTEGGSDDSTTIVSYGGDLTDLIIPEGVRSVEGSSFTRSRLVTVSLPSTLEHIGSSAFAYNDKITSLSIPAAVTRIEGSAFQSNSLVDLTFESGSQLTSIGNGAFRNNDLVSLTIPHGVDSIYYNAFRQNKLINVTLPTTLTFISFETFSHNDSLVSILLPEGSETLLSHENDTISMGEFITDFSLTYNAISTVGISNKSSKRSELSITSISNNRITFNHDFLSSTSVSLFTLNGKKLMTKTISNMKNIDIPASIGKGIYLLTITSESLKQSIRISL